MVSLSSQQKKALKKHFANSPSESELVVVSDFLQRFFLLESVLRRVGSYYRSRHPQAKSTSGHEPLNIQGIKRSFENFKIKISNERLELLLDSSRRTRSDKSARVLRNAVVHHWSALDIKEINSRQVLLVDAINETVARVKDTILHG